MTIYRTEKDTSARSITLADLLLRSQCVYNILLLLHDLPSCWQFISHQLGAHLLFTVSEKVYNLPPRISNSLGILDNDSAKYVNTYCGTYFTSLRLLHYCIQSMELIMS